MNSVERPNIVLVVFDSLSATALQKRVSGLPSLQALRTESVCFDNAFSCSPESGPARASLFTGLDMAAHGVYTDGVTLPKRELTMSEVFQCNGYETWLVGRRQLAGVSNWTTEHARPYEYHHFDWAHGPLHRSRQNAYLIWLQAKAPDTYDAIFPTQANPDDTDIPAWQRQAMSELSDELSFNAWVGKQCCERLTAHAEGPFFGVASFAVGATGGARDGTSACFEGLDESALIQADAALGSILKNLSDDTIVVITAGRGNEGATHIPLYLRMSDQSARTIDGPVSAMDLAPTLYSAASIVSPQRIQGQTLLGMPQRGWALSRLRHPDLSQKTLLQTDQWKIVMSQVAGIENDIPCYELYDLHTDPDGVLNVADMPEHADTLEYLVDLLIDSLVALEDRTEPRIAKF